MSQSPLDTVIVGYGHAARSFHLPALAELVAEGYASGTVTIVDPRLTEPDPVLPPEVRLHHQVDETTGDPDSVVHVCTPPDTHVGIVLDAYKQGYRRFVVEKPMATTDSDARRLVELCETGGADVLVVANWASSALTGALRDTVRERAHLGLREVTIAQFKPRIERTMRNPAHRSAFDVEMPHLVALALSIVDEPVELTGASCTDLVVSGRRYPGMGGARLSLRTADGVPVRLHSDLTTPWRERSTRIDWHDDTRLMGFHPCDSTDRYAQLYDFAADGRRLGHQLFYDDTVRQFLLAAYAHFTGTGPKPSNDARFGARITTIISAARSLSAAGDH